MSIIPVSRLTQSDLAVLGNNVEPKERRRRYQPSRPDHRLIISAVNRSLASAVGERVTTLHRPLLAAS